MVRLGAQVAAAYVLLLLLGALWRLLPWDGFAPDIALLFAAYLGLTARERAAPSIASAILIGYLADLLFGTPVGLVSLICGLTCTTCHLIQGRLLVRGPVFTIVFSAGIAFVAGVVILLIRGSAELLPLGWGDSMLVLAQGALVTGLFGPLVFRVCRYVDSRFARTRREREAAASGILA